MSLNLSNGGVILFIKEKERVPRNSIQLGAVKVCYIGMSLLKQHPFVSGIESHAACN